MSFTIIRNDITRVSADAIVNTANPKPVFSAGTDAAVYQAAGEKRLLKARKKIGDIPVGEARETPAFALHAKYIIHTAIPSWIDGAHGEHDQVRACYENSLRLAEKLGCESIAFPLIATGNYGFPKADALQIAISAFSEFLTSSDMMITLVVFDPESFVLSGRIFSGIDSFIDEHYVENPVLEEYSLFDRAEGHRIRPEMSGMAMQARSMQSGPAAFGAIPKSSKRPRRAGKSSGLAKECRATALEDACFEPQECTAFVGAAAPGRTLEEAVSHVGESFHDMLFRLIDERGYKDPDVYKKANLDRKLFSKIRSNAAYKPRKSTVIALALALRLNLDDTRDFLGRAGYALSPGSISDLIIEYFIEHEVFDIYQINLALFDHGQECLGD